MKISLIIPCFNEETSITPFYDELNKVSLEMNKYEFEIIFVDDGSSDKTLSVIKSLAKNDERITYISFSKNFGKEAAMYAGFCNSTGDYTAVMDADMQDPPSLLPKMIEILESGDYDSVATRRVTRKGEPVLRSFFANCFYKIMKHASKVDIVSGARDFRLMKREMVDAIVSMCEHNRFSKAIFGWIGFKTAWLPFENVERVSGKSKWNFFSLFKYSIDGILGFSSAPLKISNFLGIILLLGSLTSLGFGIYEGVTAISQPAYNSQLFCLLIIIASVAFVGSITLFSLGFLGMYISKIYGEVKGRPHYIVAQTNKKDVVKK